MDAYVEENYRKYENMAKYFDSVLIAKNLGQKGFMIVFNSNPWMKVLMYIAIAIYIVFVVSATAKLNSKVFFQLVIAYVIFACVLFICIDQKIIV